MAETLNEGDVTTALAKWLETVAAEPDKNAKALALLMAHYSTTTTDATTLLAMFLRRVQP